MFFVRAALIFLIVVLSSTTTILSGLLFKKVCAAFVPRALENASIFITNIFKSSESSYVIALNFSWKALVLLGVHLNTFRSIRSGRCVGISPFTQLSNTPLGAKIRAALISFRSYSIPIVSQMILDFPVPISRNNAQYLAAHETSKTSFWWS